MYYLYIPVCNIFQVMGSKLIIALVRSRQVATVVNAIGHRMLTKYKCLGSCDKPVMAKLLFFGDMMSHMMWLVSTAMIPAMFSQMSSLTYCTVPEIMENRDRWMVNGRVNRICKEISLKSHGFERSRGMRVKPSGIWTLTKMAKSAGTVAQNSTLYPYYESGHNSAILTNCPVYQQWVSLTTNQTFFWRPKVSVDQTNLLLAGKMFWCPNLSPIFRDACWPIEFVPSCTPKLKDITQLVPDGSWKVPRQELRFFVKPLGLKQLGQLSGCWPLGVSVMATSMASWHPSLYGLSPQRFGEKPWGAWAISFGQWC